MVQKKRLGEIALLQRGLTYNKGDEVPSSSKVVLRSNNIDLDSHSLDLSELKYLREDFVIPEDRKVKKDSIFICMSNGSKQHVGKVAYIDRDMDYAFGGFMGLIVPKPSISSKYVFYACNSSSYRTFLSQIGNGIGITNLRFSDLEQFEVPVPSIEEQQRIVAELDLLTSIIDKKNAQLRDLDALAQSIFYELFGDPITNDKGWPVKAINDSVVEMFLGPFGSSLKTESYVAEEDSFCMVYEQKHAIKKTLNQDNHYIDEDKYASLKRFEVLPGDFIMSCRGTIGEIFELPPDAPRGIIHPSLMKIRLKRGVYEPNFFKIVLGKVVAEQEKNGGVVKMAITAKALGQIKITVPPIGLQQRYEERVSAILYQKGKIEKTLIETQDLLNSRMASYFG